MFADVSILLQILIPIKERRNKQLLSRKKAIIK